MWYSQLYKQFKKNILYIECCKLQCIAKFLNIFNLYKKNVYVDNRYTYYRIIKCKFYEFKTNFKYFHQNLNLDTNFKVNS